MPSQSAGFKISIVDVVNQPQAPQKVFPGNFRLDFLADNGRKGEWEMTRANPSAKSLTPWGISIRSILRGCLSRGWECRHWSIGWGGMNER